MTLHRAFVASKWLQSLEPQSIISIPDEVVHRLSRVVRVKPDELIELFDGTGLCVRGFLVSKEAPQFRIETTEFRALQGTRICLAQALVPQSKLEEIVQHCTELGAHEFLIFSSKNSVAKVTPRSEDQMQRLSRIATDASRQCERPDIPGVVGPMSFEALLLLQKENNSFLVVGEPRATERLVDVLPKAQGHSTIVLVIGPEGGLQSDEVQKLQSIGAHVVSYAPHVLRTESAGLVGLSIIQSVVK